MQYPQQLHHVTHLEISFARATHPTSLFNDYPNYTTFYEASLQLRFMYLRTVASPKKIFIIVQCAQAVQHE
jgi:hypothetical protein